MDARQQRGAAIAAKGSDISGKGVDWYVESQSGSKRKYRVNPFAAECSCPDHQETNSRCKHIWAVEIVMRMEMAPDGTSTVTRATRVTYSQEWSAYNEAQTHEKDRFVRLLADLAPKSRNRHKARAVHGSRSGKWLSRPRTRSTAGSRRGGLLPICETPTRVASCRVSRISIAFATT